MEVLYTGYLIKSPAQPALTKNTVRIILQFNLKLKYLQSVKDSSSVRETKQFYLSLTEIMEASFLHALQNGRGLLPADIQCKQWNKKDRPFEVRKRLYFVYKCKVFSHYDEGVCLF